MLRASGAMDSLAAPSRRSLDAVGIPASVVPLVLVRPLSGGGALGVVADVLRAEGPDGYAGRLASVMAGSTETTFYVLAVYFGAVGVSRYRHALPAALIADLAGFAAAIAVRLVFGGRDARSDPGAIDGTAAVRGTQRGEPRELLLRPPRARSRTNVPRRSRRGGQIALP